MANPDLTLKELHFIQRMICKVEALDMTDLAATKELREIEFAVGALMALVREREVWKILLENEPDGPLH